MVSKGNHPEMALFQISEILQSTQSRLFKWVFLGGLVGIEWICPKKPPAVVQGDEDGQQPESHMMSKDKSSQTNCR